MSDGGTVFTVKFACDNCGKEWSEEYHEKVRVWRIEATPSFSSATMFHPGRPSYLIASDDREKPIKEDIIECPKCKTHQDVKIVQRIPIEERSTID